MNHHGGLDTHMILSYYGLTRKTLKYYWNSIRSSIQFTMKKEQVNWFYFLDVLITHTERGLRSSVYGKPTFSGQHLNFNSTINKMQRKGSSDVYNTEQKPSIVTLRCIKKNKETNSIASTTKRA